MASSVKQKIFSAYLVVLILGAILAGLVYTQNDNVLNSTDEIVNKNLPSLQGLFSLKNLTTQQKSIVYNYYASGNRKAFTDSYRINSKTIYQLLGTFKTHPVHKQQIPELENTFSILNELIIQLDEKLSINSDSTTVIELLTDITNQYQVLPAIIESMITDELSAANKSGWVTNTAVTNMKLAVIGLSIAIFIISLFAGYYIYNYIKDQTERKSLSMFPERNPNPVLRLTHDGKLEYANPMADALLKKIDNNLNDPLTLLPEEFMVQLHEGIIPSDSHTTIDYQIGTHILECNIHYLSDLRIFHIYITDITDRKLAEQQLKHQAYHDALTSLPNRLQFMSDAQSQLLVSKENEAKAAIIVLWLDRFNVVTGSLGHGVGEKLLQVTSSRLKNAILMCEDLETMIELYRIEGIMFSLLVHSFTNNNTPDNIARHILKEMKHPLYTDNREFFLSFSIGISVFPDDGDDVTSLLRNAESAMQYSKQHGGNSYHRYSSDMNAKAVDRLILENNLRHAISKNELELYYQPQVCLETNKIVGCEALLRWHHPHRGIVMPLHFISITEETGLITPIGEWILQEACRQNKRWQDKGLKPIVTAVNISPRQFHHPDFFEQVEIALGMSSLDPAFLELEITESVAMHNIDKAIGILDDFKILGVRLSIDDFGTGFSSMSYLKHFPIDKLKIDQAFIKNITHDSDDAAITQAIITLGRNLNMDVIAEGVETEQQLQVIKQLQCNNVQGYLFGKPMPTDRFETLLREQATAELT